MDTPDTCLVIAPIGDEGSDTRTRSDEVFEQIIGPPVVEVGLRAVRGDEIDRTGSILGQVVKYIRSSPVMVADLTGCNPNVMYELAAAHADRKPVVLIRDKHSDPSPLPFDIASERVIGFDIRLSRERRAAQEQLSSQLRQALAEPESFTPILKGIDLEALVDGGHLERLLGTVLSRVNDLHVRMIATEGLPVLTLMAVGRRVQSLESAIERVEHLVDRKRDKQLKEAVAAVREHLDALGEATMLARPGRTKRALASGYLKIPAPVRSQIQAVARAGLDVALAIVRSGQAGESENEEAA